jgi:hypothetical protein
MVNFINISEEATSLLVEILEHEKESNYWPERFKGMERREDTILRGCFGELKDNKLINVVWADNLPYQISILKDGYIIGEDAQKEMLESLSPFEKSLHLLIKRTKTIKSPINAASINVSISEYNKPSNVWINDFEIFYNKYLKDHPLAKRIETILFHRSLDAYNDLVAILESISKDTDFIDSKKVHLTMKEEDMKDYEILLKKLIPKARKDDWSILTYEYANGERVLFKKLEEDGLIENVRYIGMKYIGFDFTYNGYHYFDQVHEKDEVIFRVQNQSRKMYDVFLSHASSDKISYVEELKQTLDVLGVQVFYDKDTIEWGDKWKEKIYEGLEKSEFAIIVISENFFGREWTEEELKSLLERQNTEGQKLILPILHNITTDQLKEKYPTVADIQAIESKDNTYEKIVLLFARQLIKRYK